MGRLAPTALVALVFALALAAWVPATHAGTAEAPEITDAAGDQVFVVVPTGSPVDQFTSADLLAAWFEETATDLVVHVQQAGTGTTSTTTEYTYTVFMTVDGTENEASATSTADQPTPGGVATAAAVADGIVSITVPKDAIGATVGTSITAIAVEANGNFVDTGILAATDTAPDDGQDAGISYTVTGGEGGGGSPGDTDGDGLNDTKEQEQFGNVSAQNGTGDPDGDGLNNTEEFDGGTNATKADTDGDGLDDKEDSDPLDPSKPGGNGTGNGTGNATADLDADGLPDSWEREHFNSTTEQTGTADPDSDGLQNKDEFAKGTDPNEADTDGDGLNDSTDPKPLTADAQGEDRLEMYAGAPMFAAIATLCLFALGRKF